MVQYRVFRSRSSFSRRLKMTGKPNLHNKTSQYYYHKVSPFCLESKKFIKFFNKYSKFWISWFNDENFSKIFLFFKSSFFLQIGDLWRKKLLLKNFFFEKFSLLNQLLQNFEHLLKNFINFFDAKQNDEALW